MTRRSPLSPCSRVLWAALSSGLLSGPAIAQTKPSEAELFGAPAVAQESLTTSRDLATAPAHAPDSEGALRSDAAGTAPEPARSDARDAAILGAPASPVLSLQRAPADPLTIGGLLYLRTQASALEKQRVADYSFRMPSLLDVFFDARPNDRVRGFVLGRMTYDPTLPDSTSAVPDAKTLGTGTYGFSGTSGSAALSSLVSPQTSAPRVYLDQLWVRFDLGKTLFITAGRQHVRWGTARFWMPADFLHTRRRNPLDLFDARTGTTMVKVHLPIESLAWNFYAYAVTENEGGTPSLSDIAGAARAEFVLGPSELGLGAFLRRHGKPKYAADLSLGLGPFDLYGEFALVDASNIDRVGYRPDATPAQLPSGQTTDEQTAAVKQLVAAVFPVYRVLGYRWQAAAGLSLSCKYNDNDTFTLGAEYFYNTLGYPNADFYPGLILPHPQALHSPVSFFYLGEHYGAVFMSFPAPFKADLHSFTLSALGNLSDRSYIARFDYTYTLLTHLRFELFVSGHYGERSGEFRLGFDLLKRPPALFDVGLALRLST
ncbi:MAG TPA: hypothetical protein VG963_05355 [Polyangiaceae bacterium]|nr:hypothetical protein [Polyangiaceae bacterium]